MPLAALERIFCAPRTPSKNVCPELGIKQSKGFRTLPTHFFAVRMIVTGKDLGGPA